MTPGLQWVSLMADAYRVGGSTLGAAVFDRAGDVGPLRSPTTCWSACAGGCRRGTWWWWPMAATPSGSSCGIVSKPIVVVTKLRKDASLTTATAAARPDRAAPGSARDCPVPLRYWTIPLPPTAPPGPTAVPPWSSLRAWRCGTTAGRRAFPYVGSSSDTCRSAAGPMLCYAPTSRRNPCTAVLLRWQVPLRGPTWAWKRASGRNVATTPASALAADLRTAWRHGAAHHGVV